MLSTRFSEPGALFVMAGEGQQLGLQVGGEGMHRQPVAARVGDRQRPAPDLGDGGLVVVHGGGRHSVRVAEDIRRVGQLPRRQPSYADTALVGPLGQQSGPPSAERGKEVIKRPGSEIVGPPRTS